MSALAAAAVPSWSVLALALRRTWERARAPRQVRQVETAPVLNDTYLSATDLPERNLAAKRWEEGEEEGLSTSLALERLSLRVERATRSRLCSPKRGHPEPSLSRS